MGYTPNIEDTPRYLCKHCGVLIGSKCTLRCHMETLHSGHRTIYHCSRCSKKYNCFDNMRTHVRNKHHGQVTTGKLPNIPLQRWILSQFGQRNWRILHIYPPNYWPTTITKQPLTTNQYIYQQSLKRARSQFHGNWDPIAEGNQPRIIPTTPPATSVKDSRLPSEQSTPISNLDNETLAELEALNKELLTELALLDPRSSTPNLNVYNILVLANSAPSIPCKDPLNGYQLENNPKDWGYVWRHIARCKHLVLDHWS